MVLLRHSCVIQFRICDCCHAIWWRGNARVYQYMDIYSICTYIYTSIYRMHDAPRIVRSRCYVFCWRVMNFASLCSIEDKAPGIKELRCYSTNNRPAVHCIVCDFFICKVSAHNFSNYANNFHHIGVSRAVLACNISDASHWSDCLHAAVGDARL